MIAHPLRPQVLRLDVRRQVSVGGEEFGAVFVVALIDLSVLLHVNLKMLLDVALSRERFIAEITGEADVVPVDTATMLDEKRPLRECCWAERALVLSPVDREVLRVAGHVQETFAALRASVWESLRVGQNLVLPQLELATEFLNTLAALMREQIHVMSFVVPVHVALVGEHLKASWMIAGHRRNLCLPFVRLPVTGQVRFVCVSLRTAIVVALECFLK